MKKLPKKSGSGQEITQTLITTKFLETKLQAASFSDYAPDRSQQLSGNAGKTTLT